jgi:hypothetical protein
VNDEKTHETGRHDNNSRRSKRGNEERGTGTRDDTINRRRRDNNMGMMRRVANKGET